MKKYRNEWKYEIQKKDALLLKHRLDGVLQRDMHGDAGEYLVHSLYFDDYQDTCAKDTEKGISARYKYRIRYYGDKSDLLKLEKKEKLEGMCHKKSCFLTPAEYESISNHTIGDLLFSQKPLLREFAVDAMSRLYVPKAIIDYQREAYVDEGLNIRVTFDANISASGELNHFLDGQYLRYPILADTLCVLEVKFDYILPGPVKNLINDETLIRQSFSKYYLGRKKLQEMGINK